MARIEDDQHGRNDSVPASDQAAAVPASEEHRPPVRAARARQAGRSWSTLIDRLSLQRFSGIYIGILLIILFCIISPNIFRTAATARIILNEQIITMIVAFAAMIPVATGVYDLSVAQMLGFSGIVVAVLQEHGINVWLSVVLTLVVAVVVGVANAIAVVKFRINSFIATLAMTSLLAGAGSIIANNQDVTTGISASFLNVGQWAIPGLDISGGAIIMLVVGVALWYVLERVPIGRRVYAVGDNPEAAKLAGLRVNRAIAGAFIASALLASVAGLLLVGQVGQAQQVAGPSYLLPAFSAVFLGATQILPGKFNVRGTVVAVYLLAIGVKGLQLTTAAPWVDDIFVGGALLVAVALSRTERKYAGARVE
jgi:ribose transport system permease protein